MESFHAAESLATFATSFPLTAVYFDSPGIKYVKKDVAETVMAVNG